MLAIMIMSIKAVLEMPFIEIEFSSKVIKSNKEAKN